MESAAVAERVRAQVDRIARSPAFARADRLRDFLRFIVDKTLAGEQQRIKETVIALEVCGRDATFDPKIDPIVRVDANRLRARLEAYYAAEGRHDAIRIMVPRGTYVPTWTGADSRTSPTSPARSVIAVLPFVDLGPRPDDAAVGEGIADELIHQLSRVPGLRVIARASAFQLRGHSMDLRRLASDLGVTHVVEGSSRIAGDQIRVTAQLTDVADCTVGWSGKYERKIDTLLAVQDEIGANLARALQVELSAGRRAQRRGSGEAHAEYLKGRYFWNRRTADALQKSLEHYARAVAIDPQYAPAYCGMADTLIVAGLNERIVSNDAFPRARAQAERALELEADLPEALVSLAAIASVYEWDWVKGERLFRRAISLNPGVPLPHYLFAIVNLAPRALWDEAYIAIDRAIELDPVSPVLYRDLGIVHYLRGQQHDAADAFAYAQRLDPSFHAALFWQARALAEESRFAEALALLEARLAAPAANTRVAAAIVHTLARMGRVDEARERLALLETAAAKREVPPLNLAIAYLGLEETETALLHLQQAAHEHAAPLYQLGVDPIYRPLRTTAAFREILDRMQLRLHPPPAVR